MSPAASIPITGSVLQWARAEDGISKEDLASRLKVDVDDLEAWETGDRQPSRGQFSKLVEVLRRPRALFFLPAPPAAAGIPASLRSAPGLLDHELARDERRRIRETRRVQLAVSWLLKRMESDLVTIPQLSLDVDPDESAATLRSWLEVSVDRQIRWLNPSDALKAWRSVIEEREVLAFQLQLGTRGVRGFSLSDDLAPLVAVNTAYNPAARIYTLLHELAHLASRTESACYSFVSPGGGGASRRLERWCEEVAAATLLPRAEFERILAREFGVSSRGRVSDFQGVRQVADKFKVSLRAAAARLIKLELGQGNLYDIVDARAQTVDRPEQAGGRGGMDTAERRISQYGTRLPALFVDAVRDGTIGARDAIDYLGVNLSQMDEISSLVGREHR